MEAEKKFLQSLLLAVSKKPVKHSPDAADPSPALFFPLPPASRPFELRYPEESEDNAANSDKDLIEITVKQLKGSISVKLKVGKFETVDSVKKRVEQETGVSAASQRLILGGKALVDGKTMLDFEIDNGAVIHLLMKPGSAAKTNAAAPAPAKEEQPSSKPSSSKSAAKQETFGSKAASVGSTTEFWGGIRTLVNGHFKDPQHQLKVLSAFGDAYLEMISSGASASEKEAVRKTLATVRK